MDEKTIATPQTAAAPSAQAASGSPQAPASSTGFERTLSIFDMVVYGLIFMVPIAPFSIYGSVFDATNGMPALAYLVGLGAMIFTVLSFDVMIKRFPSSGSIYTYATRTIGSGIGFVAGWLMLMQYLVTPDLMFIMAGEALNEYVPQVPVWGWCLIFLAFVLIVSLRDIKATVIVDRVAIVIELLVLGMFVAFGISFIVSHPETSSFTPTAVFNPDKFSVNALMSGVSLCVLSYVGFGSVATLTDEAKNPTHGPSRAMLIVVLVLGAIFFGMCFIATCINPTGSAFTGNADNGFYLVAELVGGHWFGILCAVTVAIALGVFTGLEGQTSVSRILYVMGKSGSLPKPLGRLNPKTNAPMIATLFVSALSAAMLFPLLQLGMDDVAKVANVAALTTYLILNVCVIWFCWIKAPKREHVVRMLICPSIGALVCIAILVSFDGIIKLIGAAWVVIGIIYYLVATKVMHRTIQLG